MTLLFDRDSIDGASVLRSATPDLFLVRLLRLICYIKQITLDDFFRLYQSHGRQSNWSADEIRMRHNNDRKSISSASKLTMFLFIRIVYNILRLDIVSIAIVVADPVTGERVTYSSAEPVD